ncbi:MAG: aspartate/glutamate racemase family protein [Spirochaetota bacterium]
MEYRVKPGQYSYGEAMGILLIENYLPFIPGDVANATSYSYPVRFQNLPGVTAPRLFAKDPNLVGQLLAGALALEAAGVRAITGDCGFLANFQDEIASALRIPVFLSSMLQVPFMRGLRKGGKIGVITANAEALTPDFMRHIGLGNTVDLVVYGLENSIHFHSVVFKEEGLLDTCKLEIEVTELARRMVRECPELSSILLECSILPPYGKAVHDAVGLPVFDYHTMVDYLYSAVVKSTFSGFM